MIDHPKVSVIILAFNGLEHSTTCLSSLRKLDYPASKLEIIVVDNGSTDGSPDKIEASFPEVHLVRSETNTGFSRGANLGASKASGEYLALLNNDMRVDPLWLTALVERAIADGRCSCVGSLVLNWEGTAVDFAGRADDAFCLASDFNTDRGPEPSSPSEETANLFVSAGAALFRASHFREVGGFDPDYFLYHEDVDLGWRLCLKGYKCLLSPKSIVYHQGGATSKKLPTEYVQQLAQRNILFTLFKNLEAVTLSRLFPFAAYVLIERCRWDPAAQASIEASLREFDESFESLLLKRAEVQRTRVISDTDLFSMLGHPLDCLLAQERYKAIHDDLATRCSHSDIDRIDADEARSLINEWMRTVHVRLESDLSSALSESISQVSGLYSRFLEEESEAAAAKSEAEKLLSKLAEREERIQILSRGIVRTRSTFTTQLRDAERRFQALSTEMANTTTDLSRQILEKEARIESLTIELARIKHTLGWRLLDVYGRVKYRWLLPIYRLFSGSKQRESAAVVSRRIKTKGAGSSSPPV